MIVDDATWCGWGFHRWVLLPAAGVLVARHECRSCRAVEPVEPVTPPRGAARHP